MKKNIFNPFLLIAILSFFITTNTVQAQTVNKITIAVTEIGYDDPNFVALRESLKKNPKVKSLKPSYADGVAILTITYSGEAPQLWEEIPKTSKKLFNLAEMNDEAITLNYLNTPKNGNSSTTVTNSNQIKTTNKKDCFDCDYFPMCTYDRTRNFDGKLYREMSDINGNISYYYCENGVVTRKWITSYTPTDHSVDVDIFEKTEIHIITQGDTQYSLHTKIILKSNSPEGTSWKHNQSRISITNKDTSLIIDGARYSNVILVEDVTDYRFYAKGFGLIKELTYEEFNRQKSDAILSKGTIDQDLVGSWFQDKGRSEYNFNANGSGHSLFSTTSFFKWSIIDNNLYILEDYSLTKHELKKLLPSITIDGTNYKRTKWENPKNDTALNRQLIESIRFRFVASSAFPLGGKSFFVKSKNELVIKKDTIVVLLPLDGGSNIQFTSSKYKYSLGERGYFGGYNLKGWKININAKNMKESFDFELKGGFENRQATLTLIGSGRQISYSGYIIDLEGN